MTAVFCTLIMLTEQGPIKSQWTTLPLVWKPNLKKCLNGAQEPYQSESSGFICPERMRLAHLLFWPCQSASSTFYLMWSSFDDDNSKQRRWGFSLTKMDGLEWSPSVVPETTQLDGIFYRLPSHIFYFSDWVLCYLPTGDRQRSSEIAFPTQILICAFVQ